MQKLSLGLILAATLAGCAGSGPVSAPDAETVVEAHGIDVWRFGPLTVTKSRSVITGKTVINAPQLFSEREGQPRVLLYATRGAAISPDQAEAVADWIAAAYRATEDLLDRKGPDTEIELYLVPETAAIDDHTLHMSFSGKLRPRFYLIAPKDAQYLPSAMVGSISHELTHGFQFLVGPRPERDEDVEAQAYALATCAKYRVLGKTDAAGYFGELPEEQRRMKPRSQLDVSIQAADRVGRELRALLGNEPVDGKSAPERQAKLQTYCESIKNMGTAR